MAIPALRIGTIEHYYPRVQAAIIRLDHGELQVGDVVQIRGRGVNLTERVCSLQVNRTNIARGRRGEAVGLWVPCRVRRRAEVYKVSQSALGNADDR